jgi:uncharacterized membrane protein YczE
VALLESRLGLAPWDVLHQGLARHTPLSLGAALILVSIIVLGLAWVLGGHVGFGTLANAIIVGGSVQILTSLGPIAELSNTRVELRACLVIIGLSLMGAGTALYLGADFGAGPRDALMLVGAQRTPFRISIVRGSLEIMALIAGAALGGTVGVGTLCYALGIGPTVEVSFWLLERSPFAVPVPGPHSASAVSY